MKVAFIIPGEPKGKQRPRVMKTGITYTPKETVSYENLIKFIYSQLPEPKKFEGPVNMWVKAYFSIPKSSSKTKAYDMKMGSIRPIKKPDWDNIGKIISDALNTMAYHDDSQVVDCEVQKFYSDNPRVEVEIWN
jgi:Holliday junction resolvase RusA-like endonuclease